MARVSWTSQALDDLQAIGDFIARDAPAFAQVFVDKAFESVERLENFPRSGRIVPEINQDNIREIILGSYRVVYLLNVNEVKILTVFQDCLSLLTYKAIAVIKDKTRNSINSDTQRSLDHSLPTVYPCPRVSLIECSSYTRGIAQFIDKCSYNGGHKTTTTFRTTEARSESHV